ncbi:MAG: flagellar motor protein MotB [Microthrixaceae bacterium]|nr:flagellar motor protein MotB [Microthrixaceae bacterium]
MSGKKKRHHHEEHEEHVNHEAWVIPYADMLTLLMAMFLVLWAIGQVDIDKAKAVSTGFADEFGLASSAGSGAGGVGILDGVEKPKENAGAADKKPKVDKTMRIAPQDGADAGAVPLTEQLEQVQQQIIDGASESGIETSLRYRTEQRGLVVSIVAEGVLFDGGSAELKPAGKMVLDSLADSLSGVPNQLAIEGHTDSLPISTAQFASNWELSTARSSSVLRYLISRHGIAPVRLSASGYADQRPVDSNDTDGGRARNRRVDIAVLSLPGDQEKDGKKSTPTTTTTAKDHQAAHEGNAK